MYLYSAMGTTSPDPDSFRIVETERKKFIDYIDTHSCCIAEYVSVCTL